MERNRALDNPFSGYELAAGVTSVRPLRLLKKRSRRMPGPVPPEVAYFRRS